MTLGPRSVAIDTGLAGVHDAGTALRLDDVPLPVRAVLAGPPAAAPVVKALRDAVGKLHSGGRHEKGVGLVAGDGLWRRLRRCCRWQPERRTPRPSIANASKAMGADGVNSIMFYGSGANFGLGQ